MGNGLQRRDAESAEEAQSSCHDGVVVELDGKPWQASPLQWHGGWDRPSPCVACRASQCRDKPTDDKKRSSVPPGSTQNQRVAGGFPERKPKTVWPEGARFKDLRGSYTLQVEMTGYPRAPRTGLKARLAAKGLLTFGAPSCRGRMTTYRS